MFVGAMDMKLTHIRLCVDDVKACYAFYKNVLALEPVFDGSQSVYAEFRAGAVVLALFKRDLMAEAVGTTALPSGISQRDRVAICFEVADVDRMAGFIKGHGVVFDREPHDQPSWALRVAHFRDPAGNLIEINGPMNTR